MDFERGRFWGFFLVCFSVGGRGILSICWTGGDWGDCGYFKRTMGFMGRVGEEVGEWESGTLVKWRGGEGKGREEEAREGEDHGDGER